MNERQRGRLECFEGKREGTSMTVVCDEGTTYQEKLERKMAREKLGEQEDKYLNSASYIERTGWKRCIMIHVS